MTRYISTVDTAKLLRKALRAAHPAVKFSVRSDVYAGGASIRVEWTDGPTEAAVRATTELYCGATFDGMTDMKTHHSTLLADVESGEVEEVHLGADFVFTTRELTADLLNRVAETITDLGHCTCPTQCRPCGDMMRGDCLAAHVPGGHVELVCSPLCGARLVARATDATAAGV
jgi:hypothetical protein